MLSAACTSSEPNPSDDTSATTSRTLAPPNTTDSLLFVARSDAGSLSVHPGSESTLVLDDVDAVTWFSDHPARDAGTSSVTDALEAFGWENNGDPMGDDPPNATLVAAELGTDAVVVELLTATVDGQRVRFTVDFVSRRPDSTGLSDIDLFIDDTVASPDVEQMPSGLEWQDSGGVVLGRTVDQSGQPHALVVHLAPGEDGVEASVVKQLSFIAVVSGNTYSVDGDVAVEDWRFAVDPSVTGDAAAIVVLKFKRGSLADLAKDPTGFTEASALIEDVPGTNAKLNSLIATAISRAGSGGPDAAIYEPLADKLQDPNWIGVMVFNASVSDLPGQVEGQSTAALANGDVTAFNIGFTVSAVSGSTSDSSFFATIDHPGTTPAEDLSALFENGVLDRFSIGTD